MYKRTPECWIQPPGPQICVSPYNPGRLGITSCALNQQDDDEGGDEEVFVAACHHTRGCRDITRQPDHAQWFTFGNQVPSETPTTPILPGNDYFPEDLVRGAEHVEVLQQWVGCCCGGQVVETNACGGVYGQREQEGLNPCWSGSPPNYYVVRRNVVVEVEVVEEVAVEDTVELITEDVYADGLLDVEYKQSKQLWPP